jgi:hypothetical protein
MKRRPKWSHVTIALGVIAALAIAVPALGVSNSLKKAIRKEVAKQIGNATGPAGPAGANGTNGTNGINGTNGADGTARAYASVHSDQNIPCTGGGGIDCTFDHSKGVANVQRLGVGAYCLSVPGIDPGTVPAAVTVDSNTTFAPDGNARAMISSDGCGADTFKVFTERQPATTVRDAAGTGTTSVAGNAVAADDVSFTIVIP